MHILGNRVLVSKIEDEQKEGFTTVEIQDSFLYKGKVEQVGVEWTDSSIGIEVNNNRVEVGDVIYFAKYSPHTQDIEGMKVIRMEDVIAIV